MQAYLPTMLTGQGRAYRDGIFSDASPQTSYQGSEREYADGSLGYVFRDGSLGAGAAPRAPYYVNPLQAKMRLLRSKLSLRGLGAAAPTLTPNMGSNRRLEYLRQLKLRSVRGIGEDDVSVSVSASPTVKLIGAAAILGLGAYGIYRLTKK